MKYILILSIIFFFTVKENCAQSLPANDPNWILVKYDEFDSLKTSNWSSGYWGLSVPVNNGDEYSDPTNLLFNKTAGYLSIKCEKLTTPIYYYTPDRSSPWYEYKSGTVYSKFSNKYGYWEMSAKVPAGYQGYWPAFWLFGAGPNSCTIPDSSGYYNEIDNLENSGEASKFTNSYGLNYHWRDTTNCGRKSYGGNLLSSWLQINGNITNENKYGLFWEPGKMTWYFNDIPVHSVNDPVYAPNHSMNTILNFAVDPNWIPDPLLISSAFPAYFEINYLKIWQLQSDCNNSISFCSNFNATSWNSNSSVKKSISIGGIGCTDNISTSSNVGFWATDYVLIGEGTTITSNGSGSFIANTTNCPN